MHSNHHPEHHTFPADKMLPVAETKGPFVSKRYKKFIKQEHGRRSRRFLKRELNDPDSNSTK